MRPSASTLMPALLARYNHLHDLPRQCEAAAAEDVSHNVGDSDDAGHAGLRLRGVLVADEDSRRGRCGSVEDWSRDRGAGRATGLARAKARGGEWRASRTLMKSLQ